MYEIERGQRGKEKEREWRDRERERAKDRGRERLEEGSDEISVCLAFFKTVV